MRRPRKIELGRQRPDKSSPVSVRKRTETSGRVRLALPSVGAARIVLADFVLQTTPQCGSSMGFSRGNVSSERPQCYQLLNHSISLNQSLATLPPSKLRASSHPDMLAWVRGSDGPPDEPGRGRLSVVRAARGDVESICSIAESRMPSAWAPPPRRSSGIFAAYSLIRLYLI